MKKYMAILLAILMLSSALHAGENKSAAKAMLLSAVVPGTGQAYLGSYTKTGIFLTTELLLLGTTMRLNNEVDWSIDRYQNFAHNQVGTPVGSDKTTYQNLQNYISSDAYNADMEHDAWAYFVLYYNDIASYQQYVEENRISEDEAWDWGDYETWKKYRNYRSDKQNMEMYSNLAVAAVVLNHIVGVIDTALTASSQKKKNRTHGIYLDPDMQNNGIRFGYALKF